MRDSQNDGLSYRGSFVYTADGTPGSTAVTENLESIAHDEGRFIALSPSSGTTTTQFIDTWHVRDYLGSVRTILDITQDETAVTDASAVILEQNDYLPFGTRVNLSAQAYDPSNRYRYNGKEEQVTGSVGLIDYGARLYDSLLPRWTTQDPLAEKYYSTSPYVFCNNNPVNFVDPDGRDIYRYDDKSGTFHLYQETNDDFDQVARFRYNKETGNYELKMSKNGDIKIRMDNVEKGILSDGINVLTDSQVWSTDKVSIEGFQNFIVAYSDMIGREMGGYYYSEIGGTNIKYINSGMGKNNTQTMSYPGPGIFHVQPDLYGKVVPHTNWHTHPSYADNKLEPSGEDREFKREQSKHGLKRFIILTGGSSPIEY